MDADFASETAALTRAQVLQQYAAALGRWFGLSDSNLLQVLPNLRNFDARALTFMKV